MEQITETTSLALAAYLSSIGLECVSVKQDPASPIFSFSFELSESELKSHSDFFWSHKTSIDALTYFEALKVLKSRIYQHKNQERQNERTSSF